jgi:hypothetical protein
VQGQLSLKKRNVFNHLCLNAVGLGDLPRGISIQGMDEAADLFTSTDRRLCFSTIPTHAIWLRARASAYAISMNIFGSQATDPLQWGDLSIKFQRKPGRIFRIGSNLGLLFTGSQVRRTANVPRSEEQKRMSKKRESKISAPLVHCDGAELSASLPGSPEALHRHDG